MGDPEHNTDGNVTQRDHEHGIAEDPDAHNMTQNLDPDRCMISHQDPARPIYLRNLSTFLRTIRHILVVSIQIVDKHTHTHTHTHTEK